MTGSKYTSKQPSVPALGNREARKTEGRMEAGEKRSSARSHKRDVHIDNHALTNECVLALRRLPLILTLSH